MERETQLKRKRGRPASRQELNIDEVLEVAIDVFAEKGFAGAQLKEIAERAGISKSLMNYHFQNKEELWKKAVKKLEEKLTNRLREAKGYFKDLSGVALMKAYNRQFIYFSADQPAFYKILFHEMCARSERSEWLIQTILQPIYSFSEVLLEAAKEDNAQIGKIPVANLAGILMGAANAFFIHAFQMQEMYGVNPFAPDQIERHADIVNELVFGHLDNL
ncbi:MAG: helix-turn-helix domain-containing protein [Bacteroidota bacterium]